MGSSAASAVCLRAIMREPELEVVGVVTQPDRPAGRGKSLTPCPCKAFAIVHGFRCVISPENVNSPEAIVRFPVVTPAVEQMKKELWRGLKAAKERALQ